MLTARAARSSHLAVYVPSCNSGSNARNYFSAVFTSNSTQKLPLNGALICNFVIENLKLKRDNNLKNNKFR